MLNEGQCGSTGILTGRDYCNIGILHQGEAKRLILCVEANDGRTLLKQG